MCLGGSRSHFSSRLLFENTKRKDFQQISNLPKTFILTFSHTFCEIGSYQNAVLHIHVILVLGHTVLFSVILEHKFLLRDAHALILAAVNKGNPAIEGGYFLIQQIIFPAYRLLLL